MTREEGGGGERQGVNREASLREMTLIQPSLKTFFFLETKTVDSSGDKLLTFHCLQSTVSKGKEDLLKGMRYEYFLD